MAVNNFSPDAWVLSINGRVMGDYGETDPPYTDDPIDPRSTLRRGQGGNAIRLDRINPGRSVNVSFNPGGKDSAYMQNLFNSNASIALVAQQVGTLETRVGAEGVIVNDGQSGRAGTTITDDQFTIEFNTWTATKGGD